jgi:hypothetical protein
MIKDLKDLDAGTEESYDKTEEELEKDFSRIAQEQREDYRQVFFRTCCCCCC